MVYKSTPLTPNPQPPPISYLQKNVEQKLKMMIVWIVSKVD